MRVGPQIKTSGTRPKRRSSFWSWTLPVSGQIGPLAKYVLDGGLVQFGNSFDCVSTCARTALMVYALPLGSV